MGVRTGALTDLLVFTEIHWLFGKGAGQGEVLTTNAELNAPVPTATVQLSSDDPIAISAPPAVPIRPVLSEIGEVWDTTSQDPTTTVRARTIPSTPHVRATFSMPARYFID